MQYQGSLCLRYLHFLALHKLWEWGPKLSLTGIFCMQDFQSSKNLKGLSWWELQKMHYSLFR